MFTQADLQNAKHTITIVSEANGKTETEVYIADRFILLRFEEEAQTSTMTAAAGAKDEINGALHLLRHVKEGNPELPLAGVVGGFITSHLRGDENVLL